jgi:hypothetical protein
MKKVTAFPAAIILSVFLSSPAISQKASQAVNQIRAKDLESHVTFLASPLLKGRMNGSAELEIASQYLKSQIRLIGLVPANGDSYFQPYSITKRSIDYDKTSIEIISEGKDPIVIKEPVFQLLPTGASDFTLEGDVVFAGYGIRSDKYNYNDFEGLNTEGKIILVMNRAPLSEDGQKYLFEEPEWATFMSIQLKLTSLIFSRAKAILFISDPKSGFESIERQYPGIAGELSSSKTLKGEKEIITSLPGMPVIMFVHSSVADELLKETGHTLLELQKKIDREMKPNSFEITGRQLKITEVSRTDEVVLNNIAGYIEGSDPVLKNEIVVFSGHYDHVGESGGIVHAGADDNSSGTSALLELAQAFKSLGKRPLRSLLFLWVSGEEIGLFGSNFYVNNPLFPLENTVANINLDMIGRAKGLADTTADNPMTGPSSVFVITGDQSRELKAVADAADKRSPISFDYSLSGRNAPLQLFSRSDHYNFVRKNIPVLFFTTGLHTDYHTPGDTAEKLDYEKMELITRAIFDIGLTLANRKNRIVVDNPFSKW